MAPSLRVLLADVDDPRRGDVLRALEAGGYTVHAEAVAGADGLSAALLRRGWDAVLYAGDGPSPLPARKAMALVRLADPHLPFIAVAPHVRPGDLAAVVRGFGPDVVLAPDLDALPAVVGDQLAAARASRPDRDDAHRLLLAQQAVTDHVAAGLELEELSARVLATLGDTFGWTYGAVWRADGEAGVLRCVATWHDGGAGPLVAGFAERSRRLEVAPGRGLCGRVWAFRRPAWVPDVAADGTLAGAGEARHAGLRAAVAFPIALGDDCTGVIEFLAPRIAEPDAEVSAMFATVGGQLAQYLERRRLQADESRRVEAMLRAERDRAQRYLDVAGTVIVVLDRDGEVLLINRKGCSVTGRRESELLGRDWFDVVVPPHERAAARAGYARIMREEAAEVQHSETAIVQPEGDTRLVAWSSVILRDGDGTPIGTLSSGEDVTERRQAEQQITYLAYHDPLTGLPNRSLLEEHLNLALARSRRTGAGVALLHLGLDGFKLVNDSLGHAAGDELLCRLAVRLQESVRSTDLMARTAGDEFLLLLADLQGDPMALAEKVAGQLAATLTTPFMVAGAEFQISASIGIALAPDHAAAAETLLAHADSAMHQAKERVRGGWAAYKQVGGDALERLSMAARLRRALAAGEFLLHYQPIIAVDTGAVTGVEALLRWHDLERGGLVPPGEFIPVAEQTGLIESIGDWVIGAVCRQQVEWTALGLTPQIAFNVSPRQLRRLDFLSSLAEHLRVSGADPARLTLELTESATLQDPAQAEPILRGIRELGLQLALDDFGAGYSSLSRLREMPFGTLKIDRAFLRTVPESGEASAIVTAILDLARALGRDAVAEGVETEAQRAFLADQGCPLAQGFLIARPMPPEDVRRLLEAEVAPLGS
jgi:diguanylate cyclase (GGDEF)-like protein/PAS domain S-box-containing protein